MKHEKAARPNHAGWLSLNKRALRREVSDFSAMVASWPFDLSWAFREALDIRPAHWIDERATSLAQKKERDAGRPETEVRKIKRWRKLWAQGIPPSLNFSVGDTIHHKTRELTLQVVNRDGDQLVVEFYLGNRPCGRCEMEQAGFVRCLQFEDELANAMNRAE